MAKEATIQNNVNYQTIFQNTSLGLALVDKELRMVWINNALQEWLGQDNLKTIGRHCYELYQHQTQPCKDCPALKAFQTDQVEESVHPFITPEGKKCFFHIMASPVKDGNGKIIQALELINNVTDGFETRKKTGGVLEKLKRSYERLLAINQRLNKDIDQLRQITKIYEKNKTSIFKKYHSKLKEFNVAKEELSAIIKINNACSTTLNLKNICNLIARLTCKIIHTDACVIRILDNKTDALLIEGEQGLRRNSLNSKPLRLGESISGRAAKIGRPLVIRQLDKDDNIDNYVEIIKIGELVSVVAMPMVVKGRVLGVISVYSRTPHKLTEAEISPLATFASQAAVAVQEARLYEDVHKTYFNTIRSLVLAMEARDPYTRGHADRVTRYSLTIAKELGLPEYDLEILRYAGEVHDVGKIAISDLILNKPGKLTPAERVAVEAHPIRGAEMIEPLGFLKPAIPLVRHHHERFDGKGYPDGLTKETIPFMARIMACADAFDAMTSERPYRRYKMSVESALKEIEDNMGSQFDPKIARIFIRIMRQI